MVTFIGESKIYVFFLNTRRLETLCYSWLCVKAAALYILLKDRKQLFNKILIRFSLTLTVCVAQIVLSYCLEKRLIAGIPYGKNFKRSQNAPVKDPVY